MSKSLIFEMISFSVLLPFLIYLIGSLVGIHQWKASGKEKLQYAGVLVAGIAIGTFIELYSLIKIVEYVD